MNEAQKATMEKKKTVYAFCDECGEYLDYVPYVVTKEGERLCGKCSCKRVME